MYSGEFGDRRVNEYTAVVEGRPLSGVGTFHLNAEGTGLAPFLSLVKDPETYERFERIVLLHGCRKVSELAYGETILKDLSKDEFLGDLMSSQLT